MQANLKILQLKTHINLLNKEVDEKVDSNDVDEAINNIATIKIPSGSTRPTLTLSDVGYMFFDTDTNDIVCWTGQKWNDQ